MTTETFRAPWRESLKPGDRVSFPWAGASGWEKHTGEIVAVREHPRPKMNMRTTTPLQFQVLNNEGRPVWVDDLSVSRPAPAPSPASPLAK